MKQTDLSRRAFLLGLGAVSSAALLSACNTNAPVNSGPTPSQPESEPATSPDASSEGTREPILTADAVPMTDGSTACIPLIAQIMADTTGMDLETAQSCVSTNTTAWARYEDIQADIFDHLLSILPQFDLRVFQQPAGADLAVLQSANP